MSIRAAMINFLLRHTIKKQFSAFDDPAELKKRMEASASLGGKPPDHMRFDAVSANGVPCEWVSSEASDPDRVLLYLHGGGYVFGGLDSHRDLTWRLADASGIRVLAVDYRLAPEHPFPAAVEDATACYRWLIEEGFAPDKIVIGGDSAGGGLSVATLVNARNLGLPLPSGCMLLSPWVDLSGSGDSMALNDKADPMLSAAAIKNFADLYLGDRDRRAPLASPLFADLTGLPPTLILAGSTEVLLSDAERLADKIREAGGDASLDIWPKMPHVFPLLAARVPEGKKAVVQLGEFLKNRTQ